MSFSFDHSVSKEPSLTPPIQVPTPSPTPTPSFDSSLSPTIYHFQIEIPDVNKPNADSTSFSYSFSSTFAEINGMSAAPTMTPTADSSLLLVFDPIDPGSGEQIVESSSTLSSVTSIVEGGKSSNGKDNFWDNTVFRASAAGIGGALLLSGASYILYARAKAKIPKPSVNTVDEEIGFGRTN